MRVRLLASLLFVALLGLAPSAKAVDMNPGDSCSGFPAGAYRPTGGQENPDGALVVCDGSIWQPVLRYSSAGNAVMFSSTGLPAAPVHVWGEAIIGNQGLACGSEQEGALRYTSAGDLWAYCDGASWVDLASGSGTPAAAGSDRRIQFNSGGSFGADASFVFTSAGRLGVGTASPQFPLHVIGGIFAFGNAGDMFDMGGDYSTGAKWYSAAAANMVIRAKRNGIANPRIVLQGEGGLEFYGGDPLTEHIRMTSAGNLGIGTTGPAVPLDVAGIMRAIDDAAGCTATERGAIRFNSAGAALELCDGSAWGSVGGDNLGDHTATQNVLLSGNWLSNDGDNEGVFVAADGDVGIGTNNPGPPLEVAGRIKITGGSPGLGKVLTSNSTGLASWETPSGDNLGDHTATQNVQTSGNWVSNDGDNEGAYVAADGDVGIGTSSPAAKLDVAGGVKVGADGASCTVTKEGTLRLANASSGIEYTTPGTDTYTVPSSGVSEIVIEVYGAGGGSSHEDGGGAAGGGGGSVVQRQSDNKLYIAAGGGGGAGGMQSAGGGGGAYAKAKFSVSADETFDLFVGGGGQGCSDADADDGGDGGAYNGGAGSAHMGGDGGTSNYGGAGGSGRSAGAGGGSTHGGGGGSGRIGSEGGGSTYGGGGGLGWGASGSAGSSTNGLDGLSSGEGGGGGTFVDAAGSNVTETDGATGSGSSGGAAANGGPGDGADSGCNQGGNGKIVITEVTTSTPELQHCDGSGWKNVGGAPSCIRRTQSTTSSGWVTQSASCNSGETMTGGGCHADNESTLANTYPSAADTWTCRMHNASSTTFTAYAICCEF